jgi:hypothetical protein
VALILALVLAIATAMTCSQVVCAEISLFVVRTGLYGVSVCGGKYGGMQINGGTMLSNYNDEAEKENSTYSSAHQAYRVRIPGFTMEGEISLSDVIRV